MRFGVLALCLLLGACGAKQCRIDGNYVPVEPVGPLKNPTSFALPQPDPTYSIPVLPPGKAEEYAARKDAEKGEDKRVFARDCLDFPPALPPEKAPAPSS